MKAHDAINKIKEMLNLSFKKESFATTSLEDGTEVRVCYGMNGNSWEVAENFDEIMDKSCT